MTADAASDGATRHEKLHGHRHVSHHSQSGHVHGSPTCEEGNGGSGGGPSPHCDPHPPYRAVRLVVPHVPAPERDVSESVRICAECGRTAATCQPAVGPVSGQRDECPPWSRWMRDGGDVCSQEAQPVRPSQSCSWPTQHPDVRRRQQPRAARPRARTDRDQGDVLGKQFARCVAMLLRLLPGSQRTLREEVQPRGRRPARRGESAESLVDKCPARIRRTNVLAATRDAR